MKYFAEIICFMLVAAVILVLAMGLVNKDYPNSELFAGIVGFLMREIAQCLNNHYNKHKQDGE